MKFVPTSKQMEFIYSKDVMTVMVCGRMFGKSSAASFLVVNRLTHGQSVLVVAPTYSMLSNSMIRMVKNLLHDFGFKLGKHWAYNGSYHDLRMIDKEGKETATCYFRSAENYESIRSVTNCHCLVVDEAALVPPEAFQVAMACIRAPGWNHPQYFLVSTPRGRGNFFSDLFFKKETKSITGTSYDNPHVGRASIDNMIAQYGEEFARQEIYAEIIDSTSDGVFKLLDIVKLKDVANCKPGKNEVVAGFDIASKGDDYSVISVRKGNKIVGIYKRKTPTDEDYVNFFAHVNSLNGITRVVVDETGLGSFVPSRLRKLYPNIQVVGVNFGATPIDDGYTNARAELYFNFRNGIRDNKICIDESVFAEHSKEIEPELFATDFKLNNRGKIQLISKDDIKSKLGRSPDVSDSLVLCAWNGHGLSASQVSAALTQINRSVKQIPRRNPR